MAVTDNFNRSNVSAGLGSANWGGDTADWQIYNNKASSDGYNVRRIALWTADTFANDQYCQVTNIATGDGGYIHGPCVRCSGTPGSMSGYSLGLTGWGSGSISYLRYIVNGTLGANLTSRTDFANGDVARIEIEGTSIRLYRNGTLLTTVTHTALTSGAPGIGQLSGSPSYDDGVDNFEAGSLGGVDGAATPTGAATTLAAGTLTGKGDALKVPTGAQVALSAGTPVAQGAANIATPGAGLTLQAGALTAVGDAKASVTGAQFALSAGVLSATGASVLNATAIVTGAQLTFSAGTLTAAGTVVVNGTAVLPGRQLTLSAGTLTATGQKRITRRCPVLISSN